MVIKDEESVGIFLSLLRSGLYGTPVPEEELPEKIDWNAVIRLAKKHVVTGIIIDSVQLLPQRLQPSERMAAQMKKFALGLLSANIVMEKRIAVLVDFLKRHDMNGVLLKGQGVARYYRIPQMRQCGDIDFYVGRRIYKQAKTLCKEQLAIADDPSHETEQHFDFILRGITVELHRVATRMFVPWKNASFQKWLTQELEHSERRRTVRFANTEVTLPSVDFDAIFIFYHAWRHFMSGGIGLRQICDWAMIFQNNGDDIDKEKLESNVRRFGLTPGWKLFASIAVRHLGVPGDKIPLYDPGYDKKSEKIMEDILTGGNFGYYSENFQKAMSHRHAFMVGLSKISCIARDLISLFPVMPAEATFLYFNRMYYGVLSYAGKALHKSRSES